jgi:hypothetical protein
MGMGMKDSLGWKTSGVCQFFQTLAELLERGRERGGADASRLWRRGAEEKEQRVEEDRCLTFFKGARVLARTPLPKCLSLPPPSPPGGARHAPAKLGAAPPDWWCGAGRRAARCWSSLSRGAAGAGARMRRPTPAWRAS